MRNCLLLSDLLEMVVLSQMLVWGRMFVTKSFTHTDQGHSSHTHKHCTCVWTEDYLFRIKDQLAPMERLDGSWMNQRLSRVTDYLKTLQWKKNHLERNAGFDPQMSIWKTLNVFIIYKTLICSYCLDTKQSNKYRMFQKHSYFSS